jgi:uroporphyrinogen-III decarboxylase
MTVDKLRKAYPNLIILGNISSGTLHKGTAMDVREETRATLMESGGYNYIPGPSNAVMHGTPVENVYSMIDEIEKYKP